MCPSATPHMFSTWPARNGASSRGRSAGVLRAACALLLAGCATRQPMEPRRTPDEVRAEVVQRMPAGTVDREGWARDIQVAFFAQGIAPSPENLCAVLAVTEQGSTFTAEPRVPGLARIAREEIDRRAGAMHVPKFRSEEHTSELQSLMRRSY